MERVTIDEPTLEQVLAEDDTYSHEIDVKKAKDYNILILKLRELNPNYNPGTGLKMDDEARKLAWKILSREYKQELENYTSKERAKDNFYLTIEHLFNVHTRIAPRKYSELDKGAMKVFGIEY